MVDINKFIEEEKLGYNISIVGRNLQVTEAMRNYAWEKLTKVERFHNHILDVHVNLDIQKLEHSCVIIIVSDHFKIKVQAVSTDMYASIDKAIDKLQAKIRRWKERIQEHHKKKLSMIDMQVNVIRRPFAELDEINAEIEIANRKEEEKNRFPHQIIGSETRPLKTLTADEAVMKMELSDDHFLIFRDEVDCKLKVIYRRSDGNYGVILPE